MEQIKITWFFQLQKKSLGFFRYKKITGFFFLISGYAKVALISHDSEINKLRDTSESVTD